MRTSRAVVVTALSVALALPTSALAQPASAPPVPADALPAPTGVPAVALDEEVVEAIESVEAEAEEEAWIAQESTTATTADIAKAIRSHQVRNQLTGEGVGVALIDTGVAPVDGLTDVVHGPDVSLDAPFDEVRSIDAYGHGTHLAGLITSDRPDARGIAPDATLVSVKAGASNGAVDVSQVIAAIDWVVLHREELDIRVLVLAYGTDGVQDPAVDPLAHAVETAWRNGIVVVASAGNDGEAVPDLANPARDPWVIAVGAADTRGTHGVGDDVLADFSAPGDAGRHPDVVAPGIGIVSAEVPGSYLAETYPAASRPGGLFRGHGTSQAAAIAGGAAALLIEANPSLTPDQVKAILTGTARPLGGAADPGAGAGMLTVDAAVRAARGSVPAHVQGLPASTGTGTLEGSRGTHHLVDPDGEQMLVGEFDIHGQPFDAAAWAAAATAGTSWQDGMWNGTAWTGTGWTPNAWGGRSWVGRSWVGDSWDGRSWVGRSWVGRSWVGRSWVGRSWVGRSWVSVSWDGRSWVGRSWVGNSWDGRSWD